MEVERGPTGCMLIRRDVFDKLKKEYPEFEIKQKTLIEVNGKKYNIKESDESIVGDFIDKFDNYVDFKYLLDDGFVVDKDLIPKPFSFEIFE